MAKKQKPKGKRTNTTRGPDVPGLGRDYRRKKPKKRKSKRICV